MDKYNKWPSGNSTWDSSFAEWVQKIRLVWTDHFIDPFYTFPCLFYSGGRLYRWGALCACLGSLGQAYGHSPVTFVVDMDKQETLNPKELTKVAV